MMFTSRKCTRGLYSSSAFFLIVSSAVSPWNGFLPVSTVAIRSPKEKTSILLKFAAASAVESDCSALKSSRNTSGAMKPGVPQYVALPGGLRHLRWSMGLP